MDEAVLHRLIGIVGGKAGSIYPTGGKYQLDQRIAGYNNAARFSAWCVLRDLNADAPCAGDLKTRLLPEPATMMCFRIAIRAIEAWLIADRERMAGFLSISEAAVPVSPEDLPDPKGTLINLAGRSRKRSVRIGIVPRSGSGRRVGPDYTSLMIEYIESKWRPEVAAEVSESLRRCIMRMRNLTGKVI